MAARRAPLQEILKTSEVELLSARLEHKSREVCSLPSVYKRRRDATVQTDTRRIKTDIYREDSDHTRENTEQEKEQEEGQEEEQDI